MASESSLYNCKFLVESDTSGDDNMVQNENGSVQGLKIKLIIVKWSLTLKKVVKRLSAFKKYN